MDIVTPPQLKPGEKIHYCIFHDETCMHANDQCSCVWQREGEQPLCDKSCGRITHVFRYIIEHCGHLRLSTEEIAVQMKLPVEPLPPIVLPAIHSVPLSQSVNLSRKPPSKKGPLKKKAPGKPPKPPVVTRRTLADPKAWVPPPPPPAPFQSYRIPSFDTQRIIYPGANYNPWWDMPQLIAQVKLLDTIFSVETNRYFTDRGCHQNFQC